MPAVSERAPYPVGEAARVAASVASATPEAKRVHDRRPSDEGPETVFRMLRNIAEDSLNVAPTLALCTPFFVFFSLLAGFIEYYVLSTTAHFAVFLIGSYIVFSSYFVANYYMCNNSSSYAAIPDDKRFYVLSNLIKSAVLLAYCPLAARTLYLALVHDEWSTPRIRQLGVLYAIPDAVSMLLVNRMALSTKIHRRAPSRPDRPTCPAHPTRATRPPRRPPPVAEWPVPPCVLPRALCVDVCVVVFMVVNLFSTYEEEGVGRALVVYAIFSTFAYLANLLLASRFLPVAPKLSLVMSAVAFVVYTGCLAVNWTWQLAFVWRLGTTKPSLPLLVYLALITLVVYDDCILIKWLWRNIFRTAGTVRKANWEAAHGKEVAQGQPTRDSGKPKAQ